MGVIQAAPLQGWRFHFGVYGPRDLEEGSGVSNLDELAREEKGKRRGPESPQESFQVGTRALEIRGHGGTCVFEDLELP